MMKNSVFSVLKSRNALKYLLEKSVPNVGLFEFTRLTKRSLQTNSFGTITKYIPKTGAILKESRRSLLTSYHFGKHNIAYANHPCSIRSLASSSVSQPSSRTQQQQHEEDIFGYEDPLDAPVPEKPKKPVTFVEGTLYSVVILAAVGITLAVGYTVWKEFLVRPKQYQVFDRALERVQNERRVQDLLGSPIIGYGTETRGRRNRREFPHKIWTDEDGVERVRISFLARGPRGRGNVFVEMFKDKIDSEWKYTVLAVEIGSPKPVQIFLESYVGS